MFPQDLFKAERRSITSSANWFLADISSKASVELRLFEQNVAHVRLFESISEYPENVKLTGP